MIVTRNTSTDPLPLVQISLIFSKLESQFWPPGDVVKQAPRPLKKNKHTAKATDSAVVAESIRPYAIADKLRTLRLRRSMGLTQLAEHTGFSPAMLSRLLETHGEILIDAHDAAARVGEQGDDGTNDLLVSEVIRTGELQAWFLAEHLVDTPLVRIDRGQ